MYSHLFEPFEIGGLKLRNRLTMAPMYLGYAGEGGSVSSLLLEHYGLMAQSGVAMVVVENATVDYLRGSGASRSIRADTDDNLEGLKRLADTSAPGKAWHLLQGESPCRARPNQPPVSSVADIRRMQFRANERNIRSVHRESGGPPGRPHFPKAIQPR